MELILIMVYWVLKQTFVPPSNKHSQSYKQEDSL